MTNEITMTAKSGAVIRAISTITDFDVTVNGKPINTIGGLDTRGYPMTIQGTTVYGKIGDTFLTDADVVKGIAGLVAETESHPALIAQRAKREQIIRDMDDLDDSAAAIEKAMEF